MPLAQVRTCRPKGQTQRHREPFICLQCKHNKEMLVIRKVFKSGNSIVVSLPREVTDLLGVKGGSDVSVELDR